MTPNFEVIVGTYEQFLLGYKIDNVVNEYRMEQTFATHSHLASIRSVACNKHYLASGGADETICLYDMRYRSENGKLMHHNDSVNCVTFTPDASHLLTGSSDGSIGVVRCGNWQVEKLWQKPHKGLPIEALAVHPSGKMALSTGGDGVLRTWNLVKGKLAYATNLVPRWKAFAKNINILKWSPNGEKYLIATNNKVDVYSVETGGVDEEIQLDSKIICVEFLNDGLIAMGFEDGKIGFYDLEENSHTLNVSAHGARLKCMQHYDDLLVTASSSGEIKLWRFTTDSMTLLNRVTCNSRIVCLTLAHPCKDLKYKKEAVEVEEVVPVKSINRLRMRQEVIIEDEEEEASKVKRLKKSSVRVKDTNAEEDNVVSKKKRKRVNNFTVENVENEGENHGKKRLSDDEVEIESPVKKKKKKKKGVVNRDDSSPKKRKESTWTEEKQAPVHKKMKKGKSSNNQMSETEIPTITTEKKRKTPPENVNSAPKKKKAMNVTIENGSNFSKKKKKKKIPVK
ncbi:p21-activated protein kinase-interacting protein 1-like [Belonocnema kinseyi]|uniref:p21-activated protein kinase-interacting protein 1-like n=1 Tax=Belonocnema kinseyi TaxID=2817044 RepID=UPI00143DD3F8|nr:p21-activated protein kinase-interacting protein 1-like [Belonocnema kinseyi]